jgi:hypothetical protein
MGEYISTWQKAWNDTEKFRNESKIWFWGVEIVGGGALFGVIGSLTGFNLMPINPDSFQQNAYPVVGGGLGVVIGFILIFTVIFFWNSFRAPYRQRDEYVKQLKFMKSITEKRANNILVNISLSKLNDEGLRLLTRVFSVDDLDKMTIDIKEWINRTSDFLRANCGIEYVLEFTDISITNSVNVFSKFPNLLQSITSVNNNERKKLELLCSVLLGISNLDKIKSDIKGTNK